MTASNHHSLSRTVTMQAHQPTGNGIIELLLGDIVEQQVDAIVNAANATLLGGGGVDGAIHAAAGPELLTACRMLPTDQEGQRCPTGEARVTLAFQLPADWIIHAVGPVYDNQDHLGSCQCLEAAYRASLACACEQECQSIALPAISTGAYRFPLQPAAEIAITAARDFLDSCSTPGLIRFVLFGQPQWDVFRAVLG